jgi:hypothetical protein
VQKFLHNNTHYIKKQYFVGKIIKLLDTININNKFIDINKDIVNNLRVNYHLTINKQDADI